MSRCSLSSLAVVVAAVGCSRPAPNEGELARIVDQHVAEALAKHVAPTDAGASDAAPDSSEAPRSPRGRRNGADKGEDSEDASETASADVKSSRRFLRELDEAMGAYRPELPDEEDFDKLLRCVTSQTSHDDVAMAKGVERLKGRQRASVDRRAEALHRFMTQVLPLNYRLDFDWQQRPGAKGSKTFLYSATDTAAPPLLMKLATAKKIEVPATLACIVGDYGPDESGPKQWRITCSAPRALRIVLSGKPVELHATDEVSVPLAGALREPDGVLRKTGFGRGYNSAPYGKTWVVEADAPALVVKAASCPAASDLLEAAAADGGR